MELSKLIQETQLSFFDIIGRAQYSLKTTRLVLIILLKSLLAGDVIVEDLDETEQGASSDAAPMLATKTSEDHPPLLRYVARLIQLMEHGEHEVERLKQSWLMSWWR